MQSVTKFRKKSITNTPEALVLLCSHYPSPPKGEHHLDFKQFQFCTLYAYDYMVRPLLSGFFHTTLFNSVIILGQIVINHLFSLLYSVLLWDYSPVDIHSSADGLLSNVFLLGFLYCGSIDFYRSICLFLNRCVHFCWSVSQSGIARSQKY